MALLESCYCCNLLIASVLVGVYVMVAYLIAFTIELWWILETEVTLPAPAYLLCVGYFFVFIQSALLLHGLSVKRSFFLMGWIFVLVIFSFPEAGLVLFMSLYHWELDHLYGLTELTCWVCRVCINVAGLVIVQSLYSQWKEEEEVIHRIRALTMASMIPQRVPTLPSNGTGSLIGYQNEGFVKSTNQVNGSIRRSPASINSYAPQPYLTPLNNNNNNNNNIYTQQHLNNTPQFYTPPPDVGCEFNASEFNSFSNQIINNFNYIDNNINNKSHFKRSQSLIDFRQRENPQRQFYTQSLDRKQLSKKSNSEADVYECNSLESMNVYTDMQGRYILQTAGYSTLDGRSRMRQARYSTGSGRSLAESDDFQKYSDVAL